MRKSEIEHKFSGRLAPLDYFKLPQGLTINIGSKENRLSAIGMDVKRNATLDVIASVLNTPFKDGVFTGVYFTEVLEHLPKGSEQIALSEIHRILRKGGTLIMSTPNRGVWTYMDPAYYLSGHRHYAKNKVCKLLEKTGVTVKASFTGGGVWLIFSNLVYCFMLWPIKKMFGHGASSIASLEKKAADEFRLFKFEGGSEIFVYAVKN